MLRSCRKLGLTRQSNGLSCYRNFSEVVQKSFAVRQGGKVRIEFLGGKKDILEITTAWQDHCVVEYGYESSLMADFVLKIDEDILQQELTIIAHPRIKYSPNVDSPIKWMKVTLPEMMNVNIEACHMDLRVKNKVSLSELSQGFQLLVLTELRYSFHHTCSCLETSSSIVLVMDRLKSTN